MKLLIYIILFLIFFSSCNREKQDVKKIVISSFHYVSVNKTLQQLARTNKPLLDSVKKAKCVRILLPYDTKNPYYEEMRYLSMPLLTLSCENAETIYLRNLGMSGYISGGNLAKLKKLTNLYLDSNYVNKDGFRTLSELPQLRTLSLSHNRIEELPSELKTLINLKVLDLSYNNLENMPLKPLSGFSSLEELNLENALGAFYNYDSLFYGLVNLRKINLSENGLITIPTGLKHLKKVEEINLSNNGLLSTKIKNITWLTDLKKLKTVNVQNTNLKPEVRDWLRKNLKDIVKE